MMPVQRPQRPAHTGKVMHPCHVMGAFVMSAGAICIAFPAETLIHGKIQNALNDQNSRLPGALLKHQEFVVALFVAIFFGVVLVGASVVCLAAGDMMVENKHNREHTN